MIRRKLALLTNSIYSKHSIFPSVRNISVTVNDLIPPQQPEYCCGNSCKNCVWDFYFEEMKKFNELKDRIEEAEQLEKQGQTEKANQIVSFAISNALVFLPAHLVPKT